MAASIAARMCSARLHWEPASSRWGRPLLYDSALGGAQGVQSVYEHLRNELVMTMQLAGTPTIKILVQGCVERAEV